MIWAAAGSSPGPPSKKAEIGPLSRRPAAPGLPKYPLASRLRHGGLETAPVVDDLIESLLFPLPIPRAVQFDAAPQETVGLHIVAGIEIGRADRGGPL